MTVLSGETAVQAQQMKDKEVVDMCMGTLRKLFPYKVIHYIIPRFPLRKTETSLGTGLQCPLYDSLKPVTHEQFSLTSVIDNFHLLMSMNDKFSLTSFYCSQAMQLLSYLDKFSLSTRTDQASSATYQVFPLQVHLFKNQHAHF